VVTKDWQRLTRITLPAIAERRNGPFLVLAKIGDGQALIQDPLLGRPQIVTRAEFEAAWTGRLVLMARRASLADLARKFDIGWFLQAMNKYRGLLGEVLVASFFLQVFALITPLFFQVVIDKVLVHRGLTTLDVLVFGLITVSVFESLLGALWTYVFAHTTNRIDVKLAARLYRHLIALPLAHFEARRVGDFQEFCGRTKHYA
jgi:ATP-binding cassette, subfamily B, bacterial HlyB/CyaB